jgi:hypothetical protein
MKVGLLEEEEGGEEAEGADEELEEGRLSRV